MPKTHQTIYKPQNKGVKKSLDSITSSPFYPAVLSKPKVFIKVKVLASDPRETAVHLTQHAKQNKTSKWIRITSTSGLLFLAFLAGMFMMNSTRQSQAEDKPSEAQTVFFQDNIVQVFDDAQLGPLQGQSQSQNLLTMSLSQIERHLAAKQSFDPEEQKIKRRADFLKIYLKSKKSPLVEYAETIAKLKHWKLVLAISNSESSLGKKCADNNCSGIGVEPGHTLWRKYKDKGEWAKDLDRLIEKRYKDWTLEEMNGVYNYPGSSNWVLAASQILEDLKGVE